MPTKKPAKITKKALTAAQETARLGKIADAWPVLEQAATAGSASAAYSLAEIHALRGEWDAVLDRLAAFLPNEKDIYAGNVKRDAAGLAWRAAQETGRWSDAAAVLAGLAERAVGGVLYRSLKPLLDAGGKGAPPALTASVDTPEQQRAKLDGAKEKGEAFGIVMFAKADPAFDADVLAHYADAEPKMRFEYMLQAIPAFVRAGRIDEAWRAFHAKVPGWLPVEHCQIAPIEALWHPVLRAMMTPERCAMLLARA